MFSCISEKEEPPILSKTPSRSKKLVNFFRTPQQAKPMLSEPGEEEEDEFDRIVNQESISERLKGTTPSLPQKSEYPR